ncbi:MAG: hypothetical protein WBG86_16535 [Polyangiales bacterium]
MKTSVSAMVLMMMFAIGTVAAAEDAPASDPQTDSSTASPAAAKPLVPIDSEPPELKKLAGSYTLVGSQAASATTIEASIDAAVASLGGLKKGIARKRLAAVNKAIVRLKLSSTGKQVTVGMDSYVVTAPLDGKPVVVKTPSGDEARASFKLEHATLVQEMVQSKGTRENTFRFNSDGNLVMHVKETSPQLPTPVSYSLVYKRAGGS